MAKTAPARLNQEILQASCRPTNSTNSQSKAEPPGLKYRLALSCRALPYHAAAPQIAQRNVPGRAHDKQADSQQEKTAPAPPVHCIRRGHISGSKRAEHQRPEQGGHAENIIEKASRISAEQAGLILHIRMPADHMIKTRIVGVETDQTEQKKQCPEQEKKAEQLSAEFMGVRKTNLPNRTGGFPAALFES